MSNFTPVVHFETEFDGDHVSMDLIRLKRGTMIKVAPYLKGKFVDGKITMTFDDQAKFSEVMADVVPVSVKNFSGLKAQDGTEIKLEDAVDETYFNELIGEIMGRLFAISKPTENEIKNSDRSPADSSKLEKDEKTTSYADSGVAIG